MPLNPEMRASDADRERVAGALREHTAQGRITMDELQDRLTATYAAKTFGDLQQVTADLPEEDLYDLPVPATVRSSPGSARSPARRHSGGDIYRTGLAAAWATWGSVTLICTVIWLITVVSGGGMAGFWPIWVAGPWGAVILAGTLFGPRQRR